MKKVIKIICNIILIISILIVSILVITNLFTVIRILFLGMTVGGEYPDSIWWTRTTLKGLSGIKTYYYTFRELFYLFEIPITIICVIYQIVYFKIIRKKLNNTQK